MPEALPSEDMLDSLLPGKVNSLNRGRSGWVVTFEREPGARPRASLGDGWLQVAGGRGISQGIGDWCLEETAVAYGGSPAVAYRARVGLSGIMWFTANPRRLRRVAGFSIFVGS